MGIFKGLAGVYVSVRHLHGNSLQISWFYEQIRGLTFQFSPLQRGTVFTNSTKMTQCNLQKIIDMLYLNLIKGLYYYGVFVQPKNTETPKI
jgi:hypothetical protein